MKVFLIVLASICLIWAPYLDIGIGFFGDLQATVAVLAIVVGGSRCLRTVPSEIRWVLFAMLGFTVYVLMLSVGQQSLQYVSALRVLRACIILLAAWVLCDSLWKQDHISGKKLLLSTIFYSTAAHGLLMFMQYLFPDFREVIARYTFAGEGVDINLRTRMPGLTTGGGAQLSVFQSLGLIVFPFCFAMSASVVSRIALGVGLAVIAFSVVLSGRSGMYTAVLFFPAALLYVGANSKSGGFIRLLTTFLSVSAIIALSGFVAFVLHSTLLSSKYGSDYEGYTFSRNLDMFLNEEQGLMRNDTIYELWNYDLLFPKDLKTLVVGNQVHLEHSQNSSGSAARSLDSDIGYVRILFGYGIIGSLVIYGTYVGMIGILIRYRMQVKMLSGLGVLLLVAILFFNAKEVFVFTRIGWSMCSLVFCAAVKEAVLVQRHAVGNGRVGHPHVPRRIRSGAVLGG
jgi:hypothetical protein